MSMRSEPEKLVILVWPCCCLRLCLLMCMFNWKVKFLIPCPMSKKITLWRSIPNHVVYLSACRHDLSMPHWSVLYILPIMWTSINSDLLMQLFLKYSTYSMKLKLCLPYKIQYPHWSTECSDGFNAHHVLFWLLISPFTADIHVPFTRSFYLYSCLIK